MAHNSVEAAIQERLAAQFGRLDRVRLAQKTGTARQTLSNIAAPGMALPRVVIASSDIAMVLQRVSSAWIRRLLATS